MSENRFYQVSELRTGAAEGLAKLMFCGLLVSSRILSRLVLLWYNPVTEDDLRLRHCLGVFFPMFAYASRYLVLPVNQNLTGSKTQNSPGIISVVLFCSLFFFFSGVSDEMKIVYLDFTYLNYLALS